jgi:hypothetical protein
MDDTKGRRTPQHSRQAADVATASWLPRQDPEQSNNGQQHDCQNQHHQGRVVFSLSGRGLSGIADRHGSGQGQPVHRSNIIQRPSQTRSILGGVSCA